MLKHVRPEIKSATVIGFQYLVSDFHDINIMKNDWQECQVETSDCSDT